MKKRSLWIGLVQMHRVRSRWVLLSHHVIVVSTGPKVHVLTVPVHH